MAIKLTPQQLKAINHTRGNLQLIACAGSGKTEVVARRVVEILRNDVKPRVLPANIVAFTFTDKAAAELKERIVTRCKEELGEVTGLAEMFVGTIHAFCLELLKSEVPEFLKYEVLNEVQQILLIDRTSRKSGLGDCTDLQGRALRRYIDTKQYATALSVLRESRLDDSKLAGCSIVNGLKLYRELLRSKNYLDYSSILEEAVKAMSSDKELQTRLGQRIKHLIVDEYQDVNPIQEAVVTLLHRFGADVCVVGDDDQTIYQWRGSDVDSILSFAKRYPKVTPLALEENFRSSQAVVETARDFIKSNTERLPKAMVNTNAQPYEEGDAVALSFKDPDEEAAFIAATIQQIRGVEFQDRKTTRGLSFSDCAVLLRSVAANGKPITDALRRAGIPYIVTGMNNLFDTPEAEAARRVFYFLANRPECDRVALTKAWTDANVGVTEEALDRAVDEAEKARDAISNGKEKRFSVYSLQRSFMKFMEDAELREERIPAVDGNSKRGEVVFYNLGKFSQLISDFETIHYQSEPGRKYEGFANFLENQAENAYPEGWQDNQYANPDAVRVMTVHQAKGMEWPVVFVPVLLRNRFPSKRMGGKNAWHLIPRDAVIGQERYEGTIEDERRLFYVAMTRSQKFLFMTYAPIPGNQMFQHRSEFWEDVLASKYVKRRRFDYAPRKHVAPAPKAGIASVVLTFSDLKYYFECPYQFKLRVLYGFNAPIHEALGYGKSLHDALAEVHHKAMRGTITQTTEVPRLVETHLRVPYAYPELRKNLEASAERVIKKYLADNENLLEKVEFSEKIVEVSLGEGVTVEGRIDLVRRLDTNETYIVDLKSSERAQEEDVTETQLHIYALGYKELTGRNADYVEIYELDQGKRKPRSVDEGFIADVKAKVRTAAEDLREGRLEVAPSQKKCQKCDFCNLCTAGSKYAQMVAAK